MLPWILLVSTVGDLPPSATRPVDFARDIRPIFGRACLKCHGPEKQRGGLRLDVRSAALEGGDNHAPSILPGKSADSPLIRFVAGVDPDLKMPPEGAPLSPEEVGLLRAWIDRGAVWAEDVSSEVEDPRATHWAFRSVSRPEVPKAREPRSGVRNPVDAFVAETLARSGLATSPEADRRTLVRRLYLVLHGLPPTPEEIAAFVADDWPGAYDMLVDRLLASPRYGERWARHWLDVIAFGETHGFEVNTPRENAWPYRDYVIRAFNADKPYPEFIEDQLAGDATGEEAATGFLVARAALLPGQTGRDLASIRLARQDELNDMVLNAGAAFLGLTVHCARCHDHKFDPISQRDYYAMTAIFAGVRHGERPLRTADDRARKREAARLKPRIAELEARLVRFEPLADPAPIATRPPIRPAVSPRLSLERFAPVEAKRLRFTVLASTSLEPCLDELEAFTTGPLPRNVALAGAGAKAKASSTLPGSDIHRLEHLNDGRYGNGRSWISAETGRGWVEVEFSEAATIDRVAWARDREGKYTDRLATDYRIEVDDGNGKWKLVASSRDRRPYVLGAPPESSYSAEGLGGAEAKELGHLLAEKRSLDARMEELSREPVAYAGIFTPPDETFRLNRGDPMQRKEPVAPGALSRLMPKLDLPAGASEKARRLALARSIADPANPLAARVLVNRLWHHHFGEGLVSTPSDLGHNGARPVNPELLDWLASEFAARGWSIKAMQRLIVTSATFRQSSRPGAMASAIDSGTRLLWRFPPRRLEAEVIRDSMLAVAGTLDLRMGGPGFNAFAPNDNYVRVYNPKADYGPADWRRMIYQTKVRMAQDSTFGAFDCPDAGQNQPSRPRSTTPLQALNLFNSQFVGQQATFLADRLRREAGDDAESQIRRGYRLALGRDPDDEETRLCADLIRLHDLPTFCRVLFNTNEFLFLP